MPATSKMRIATADATNAIDLACSEVATALGLPVRAEFQEIEGSCLILELRLGDGARAPAHPARLASALDRAAPDVEVLSAWQEPAPARLGPKSCQDVLGVVYDRLPTVARRALDDNLATAAWDRSAAAWHLAVPAVCATQPIVGLSHRRGYTHRFTSLEAAAIRSGLAS